MRYLGLDLGSKTLGIAISDLTGVIATSYKIIRHNEEYNKLVDEILKIVTEQKISAIVLGLPKNMNGSLGFRCDETIQFKEKLEQKTNKKVHLEDERLTTKVAQQVLINADMSRKKRKKVH